MIVYVASPFQVASAHRKLLTGYSESDLATFVRYRVRAVEQATARLQFEAHLQGASIWFYSPIAYENFMIDSLTHPDIDAYRADAAYWLELDFKFLAIADAMIILGLPGYSASTGIEAERKRFLGPVSLLHDDPTAIVTIRTVTEINDGLRALDYHTPGIPAFDTITDLVRSYK